MNRDIRVFPDPDSLANAGLPVLNDAADIIFLVTGRSYRLLPILSDLDTAKDIETFDR